MHFLIYSVENQFFSEFIRHQYVTMPLPWAPGNTEKKGVKKEKKKNIMQISHPMHLYVNSEQGHSQFSVGSFVSGGALCF